MRKGLLAALAAAAVALGIGCFWHSRNEQKNIPATREIFAMDTVMTFTAYGKNGEAAVDAAVEEVQRLDALLSTGDENSEVSRVNAAGFGTVSGDTAAILKAALSAYESTGGLFDCTIYPLMRLWGFADGNYRVPRAEEIAEALALADASKVELSEDSVTLGAGQQIDLGGIAKGYTSARVMEIYREKGVTSGMVSLGGNVQTLGAKPDGSSWRIGIQDPDGATGEILAVLATRDRAVITSGGYERYFEEDGKTYIHILDPRTGYPAESGLKSVTIVSEDGTLADGLSTALYIMGLEEAEAFWSARADAFDMILISDDGVMHVTEGISGQLSTDAAVEVISPA